MLRKSSIAVNEVLLPKKKGMYTCLRRHQSSKEADFAALYLPSASALRILYKRGT